MGTFVPAMIDRAAERRNFPGILMLSPKCTAPLWFLLMMDWHWEINKQFCPKRKKDSSSDRKNMSDIWALGKPSFQKSAVFLNIVQKAFAPPPFIWTFVLFCGGYFLNAFLSIKNGSINVGVVGSINVGVREAPCKKSFGILASYWTPPKIK